MFNEQVDYVAPDSDGDIFCRKYKEYTTSKEAVNDTLRQLEENYWSVYGEYPSPDDMKKALEFIHLFFCEIGETSKPGTVYRMACSHLSWVIEPQSPIKTAENIHSLTY